MMSDDEKISNFTTEYPQFTSKHRSLMVKLLTHDIFNRLKHVKTSTGYTLLKAIQTGVDNPHLGVGIVAGDEESYFTFKEIFDPIIEGWHGHKRDAPHKTDLDSSHIMDARLSDEFIISTRIRAGRNIRGMPLSPAISRGHRREIMNLVQSTLSTLTGDLEGKFYKLSDMTPEEEKQLINDHYLFQKPATCTLLAAANAARDWSSNRGIFYNNDKTFLVWCNEEDHIRIISMQNGGDIGAVFERFCRSVKLIEQNINSKGKVFMYNDCYGYIGTCPSNIGTSLRASVMIKLPKLSENYERFESICKLLRLQPRGSTGEHSDTVGGIWDISNKQRIGHSETELVQTMINGVKLLIAMEIKLVAGESIDDLIPKEPVPTVYIETMEINQISQISIAVQPTTESNYPEFTYKHRSLMAKYLTRELYEKLKEKRTSKEYTLDQAIQIGIDNVNLDIGIVAGDEECYEVFKELFDQIIEECHGYKITDIHHTDMDISKLRNIEKLDMNYIISTRLCIVRNIHGLSLPPGTNRSERLIVEKLISTSLETMTDELKGKYYQLDNGTLFTRDWPSGRGIFHNDEKTFLVWVNNEDHMRVISMENNGDIIKAFKHLIKGLQTIEQSIKYNGYKFMHSNHLGFISTCPSNLGTSFRVNIFVKLEKLGQNYHKLKIICQLFGLKIRQSSQKHTTPIEEIWDISNLSIIGKSEIEILQIIINGVNKLIELEKAMYIGKSYDDIFQELNICW